MLNLVKRDCSMLMIRINLLYLLFGLHCYGSLYTDVYRHFCPYTKFCSDKYAVRKDSIFAEDQIPCCFHCSCDRHCWEFSDCCPDAERPSSIDMNSKASCLSAHYLSEEFRNKFRGFHSVAKYIMQDRCPFNSTGPIADKCAEIFDDIPSLDDISVVSDSSHLSRVYRNKYCAECHGVKNVTRWNAVTGACTTRPLFAEWNVTHSNAWDYIYSKCAIHFSPPPEVPTRSVYCSLLVPDTACENGTMHMGLDVHQVCMNAEAPLFLHITLPKPVRYSNLFCYLCDKSASEPTDTVCSSSMLDELNRHPSAFLMLDIKPEDFKVSESTKDTRDVTRRCKEEEIYDKINGVCRRLHCPWYAPLLQSQCVLVGKVVPGISFLFYIALVIDSPRNPPIDFVTPREVYLLERAIRIQSKIITCPLTILDIHKFTPQQSNYPECLGVRLVRTITKECSFEFLVNQLTETVSLSWQQKMWLGNQSVQVTAVVKFYPQFDAIYTNQVEDYSYVKISFGTTGTGFSRVLVNLEMFRCLHVLLNMSEYNEIMAIRIPHENNTITKITISTLLYEGFQAVGKDVIAVCSDKFLDLINGVGSKLKTGTLIIVLYCYFVF